VGDLWGFVVAAGEEYGAEKSKDKYRGLCTPASKLAGDPGFPALSASQRASVEMTGFEDLALFPA
jgi:hypothetical protein